MTPPGLRYSIDVTLDPGRQRLDGHAVIVYRSGADTALTALYLHAYPNAFSGPKTIYAREAERQGEDYEIRFAKPRDLGWMTLDSATADGRPAAIRVDETIAVLKLPRPLPPGDSVRVALHFAVQIPRHFDRLGRTGDDYTITQWYPKVVVYDDEGWHPDPFHFLAEFYGDYGTFDVTVHVPDDYWVGATGVLAHAAGGDNEIPLQDRDLARESVEVNLRVATAGELAGKWPKVLRLETDLPEKSRAGTRFVVPSHGSATIRIPRGAPVHYRYSWMEGDDPRDEADAEGRERPLRLLVAERDTSIVDTLRQLAALAREGDTLLPSMKSLRFHAERVHDFAWVASPDYVRSDTTWSGIAVRSLSFREGQKAWEDSKRYVVDALRHHTEAVGRYVWPQFTTAEAWCGGGAMEYPMLITNEPDLPGNLFYDLDDTIAHELGHNWFYGMLGNDERAHAWLDEGFAQWIEDDYTDHKYPRGTFRLAGRLPWLTPRGAFTTDELGYLSRAWARDERPMTTPAEGFASYRDYDAVSYFRPVMMLRTLRGVIGYQAFDRFLRRYYQENLFGHPRPGDVRRAAEEAAGRDLGDFFRQWTETTEHAGFAMGKTHTRRDGGLWRSTVAIRRTDQLTPNVLVEARFADGTRQTARVSGREPVSVARFESHARLTGAVLDPRHDLVEMNRLDNQTGRLPARFRPIFDFPQTEEMTVLYGPTLWHGRDEGMRLGGWIEGRYLPMRDFPRGILGFEGSWNAGTRRGVSSWRMGWWRRAGMLGARGQVRMTAVHDEGMTRVEATVGNLATAPGRIHPWRTWWAGAQIRDRFALTPVDPRYWSPGRTINLTAGYLIETVGPRRAGRFEVEYRRGAPAFPEDGDPPTFSRYDWARVSARHTVDMLGQRLRVVARGVAGSAWRNVPREQLFDVAEGSRLDGLSRFYENDRGPLRASGHYLAEGGGGLRGYAGRAGLGQRILALNLDVTQRATGVFAFGDLGRAEASGLGEASRATSDALIGRTLTDAGVGFSYSRARVAFPVWVSRPESGERPWRARWSVSLDLAGIHPWW